MCSHFICNVNLNIYIYVYVTGTEKGLGKETKRFRVSVIFGTFGVDTGRFTDEPWQSCCACTVVSHLKIRADDCDVII